MRELRRGLRQSPKRRTWKDGKDRMAVMKAFVVTSMPFVLAEAGTGLVSILTGGLSIPPTIGAGTAVDVAILIVGLSALIMRVVNKGPGPRGH